MTTKGEWLPIDSAPKDGTEFLSIDPFGVIRQCSYMDNPWRDKRTLCTFEESRATRWFFAKHWMPLPELPDGVPPPPSEGNRG